MKSSTLERDNESLQERVNARNAEMEQLYQQLAELQAEKEMLLIQKQVCC